jgi:hypothetical protein
MDNRQEKPMRILLSLPLLFVLPALTALAEEEAIPPPPPLPAEDVYGQVEEGLEPEVTIKKREREVVEEYRIRGLPYYLVDTDHDGSLETRRNSLDNPEVVKWRIFTW